MTSDELHSMMYSVMCGAARKAIGLIEEKRYDEACECLRAARDEAEELYIREIEAELPGVSADYRLSPKDRAIFRELREEFLAEEEELDEYL